MERIWAAVWMICWPLVMSLLLRVNFALERILNHEHSELRLEILNIWAKYTIECKHLLSNLPNQQLWHVTQKNAVLKSKGQFTVCTWVYGAGLSTTASRSVAFAPASTSSHCHGRGANRGRWKFSHPCEQTIYLLFLTGLQGLDLQHVSERQEEHTVMLTCFDWTVMEHS